MKKYYILVNAKHNFGRLEFIPEEPLYDGRYSAVSPRPDAVAKFHVTSPITRKLDDDFVSGNRGNLYSEKITQCLIRNGAECLPIPCQAFLKNGKPVDKKYYFIFIKNQVPCLDFDKTSFEMMAGSEKSLIPNPADIESMSSIKLNEKMIKGSKIFYISNAPFHYRPIVSAEVGEELIELKLNGVDVILLDEFSYRY